MMSVSVETGDAFAPQKARLLFEAPFARRGSHYDVLGDGDGFVMVQMETSEQRNELHVIQNWFEELKQIAPTSN